VNPRWPEESLAGTVVLDVVLLEDGTPRHRPDSSLAQN
jgi:hypothetical protein